MTRVAAPVELTRLVAERAVRNARADVAGRGWKSAAALQPYYAEGQIGITSTMKHLLHQNRGISPFIMWWVEGRNVPITDGSGTHVVKGKEPGRPGYVTLPGGIRKWRDQKWRHPGLKPKRFLESAIAKAIRDSREEAKDVVMASLRGEE